MAKVLFLPEGLESPPPHTQLAPLAAFGLAWVSPQERFSRPIAPSRPALFLSMFFAVYFLNPWLTTLVIILEYDLHGEQGL